MVSQVFRCVLLVSLVFLSACTTRLYTLRTIQANLVSEQADQALTALDKLKQFSGRDLLYYLHAGVIHRTKRDYRASIEAFQQAKKLIGEQEVTSVSQSAGRFTISEYAHAYEATNPEVILLYCLQVLNYLELGDFNGARVEALQAQTYVKRYPDRAFYEAEALLWYLSGVVFQLNQEPDNALIAFRQAYNIYQDRADYMPFDLPVQLLFLTRNLQLKSEYEQYAEVFSGNAEVMRVADKLSVQNWFYLLVVHRGFTPMFVDVSSSAIDPDSGHWHRISLPEMEVFIPSSEQINLHGEVNASLALDVATVNKRRLEAALPGLMARALSRAIVQNYASKKAEKENELLGSLVSVASFFAQSADTRQWGILPQAIYIRRFYDRESFLGALHSTQRQLFDREGEASEQQASQVYSQYLFRPG